MQLGMIGLGRMGANMVRRLLKAGHELAVYDTHAEAVRSSRRPARAGAPSSRSSSPAWRCRAQCG